MKNTSTIGWNLLGNILYKMVGRETRFTFRGSNGWSYYFHDLTKGV